MCEVVGFLSNYFTCTRTLSFFVRPKQSKCSTSLRKLSEHLPLTIRLTECWREKKTHPKPEHRSEKLANGQLTCELIDGIDETI